MGLKTRVTYLSPVEFFSTLREDIQRVNVRRWKQKWPRRAILINVY
ncbi:hypothetical protein HMPREF0201_04759 [Cedecea davisae DSM 4568]|uniref:Uncharacterized protein n=1 Tax=Cedecea davisae DSM 4568 TaxID=566551 RepID=S3JHN3_9ENTR|nr:hypothetical protein HMPREF0201_04759 [Cedecea davisae DSM 4568]